MPQPRLAGSHSTATAARTTMGGSGAGHSPEAKPANGPAEHAAAMAAAPYL